MSFSMPPIALASRELSRRGTFKVSLLRKAALSAVGLKIVDIANAGIVHLYMKF